MCRRRRRVRFDDNNYSSVVRWRRRDDRSGRRRVRAASVRVHTGRRINRRSRQITDRLPFCRRRDDDDNEETPLRFRSDDRFLLLYPLPITWYHTYYTYIDTYIYILYFRRRVFARLFFFVPQTTCTKRTKII